MRGLKMEAKITKLDKPAVRHISKRLTAVVKPLAKELGVAIDMGSCTYGTNNCRFQIKVALLDSSGNAITEDIDCFRSNAGLFGFESGDLGKKFAYQGRSYTICGLRPNSLKYPVIAQSDEGKSYKFPCRTVLGALGRQAPAWLKDSPSG
jgi:hypothetical protein